MPVQLWLLFIFLFRVMTLLFFWVVYLLILCNFHSCTPHNSVTFLDIVMKFNRIMDQVKMICGAQASLFPLFIRFQVMHLLIFILFSKSSCMPHYLVTVWDILMKRYSLYAYFGLYTYLVEFSFL